MKQQICIGIAGTMALLLVACAGHDRASTDQSQRSELQSLIEDADGDLAAAGAETSCTANGDGETATAAGGATGAQRRRGGVILEDLTVQQGGDDACTTVGQSTSDGESNFVHVKGKNTSPGTR